MNAVLKISPAAVVTMTSLEMVDYINAERKEKALVAGVEFPSAKVLPNFGTAMFRVKSC